jgi:predicted MPP superfamily phosphohydrolase
MVMLSLLWSNFDQFMIQPVLAPVVMILLSAGFARLAWQSLPVHSIQPRWDTWAAAGVLILFGLADWLLAASLPLLNLSYGPSNVTLLAALFSRLVIFVCLGLAWDICRRFRPWFLERKGLLAGIALLGMINLAALGLELDALVVEPFRLGVTQVVLPGPLSPADPPLRILHITDLHVERTTRREIDLLALVDQLQPDLILLTGDYVNLDYRSDRRTWQDTRAILEQLAAPYGVYAVSGTPSVDTSENLSYIFSGLQVHLLQNEVQRLEFQGKELYLVGIQYQEHNRDVQALEEAIRQVPGSAFTILLYHTPDLIQPASQAGIDLYLAGHTHGGQVRLPFYGALVTFSQHGKDYEGGLYQEGPTTLFVSRGLGMEGMGFPRVRFLCPPEIALLEVGGDER